jgi:hypothetical protein
MKHNPAMFALLRLHAELVGEINQKRKEHRRLAKCMLHVEAVLKMLEPGFNVRPIAVRRRKLNPWFKRGTLFRHALDVLRMAEVSFTTREIVERMLKGQRHYQRHPERSPRPIGERPFVAAKSSRQHSYGLW